MFVVVVVVVAVAAAAAVVWLGSWMILRLNKEQNETTAVLVKQGVKHYVISFAWQQHYIYGINVAHCTTPSDRYIYSWNKLRKQADKVM